MDTFVYINTLSYEVQYSPCNDQNSYNCVSLTEKKKINSKVSTVLLEFRI